MKWHDVRTAQIPTKTKLIVRVVLSYTNSNNTYWYEEVYLTAIYNNIGNKKWDFLCSFDILKDSSTNKKEIDKEDVTHFLIPETVLND